MDIAIRMKYKKLDKAAPQAVDKWIAERVFQGISWNGVNIYESLKRNS